MKLPWELYTKKELRPRFWHGQAAVAAGISVGRRLPDHNLLLPALVLHLVDLVGRRSNNAEARPSFVRQSVSQAALLKTPKYNLA